MSSKLRARFKTAWSALSSSSSSSSRGSVSNKSSNGSIGSDGSDGDGDGSDGSNNSSLPSSPNVGIDDSSESEIEVTLHQHQDEHIQFDESSCEGSEDDSDSDSEAGNLTDVDLDDDEALDGDSATERTLGSDQRGRVVTIPFFLELTLVLIYLQKALPLLDLMGKDRQVQAHISMLNTRNHSLEKILAFMLQYSRI